MNEDHIVHIGQRHVWGGQQPFGLRRGDRRQHLYAIGKTGTGKTSLLRNLLLQDIAAGEGVGVIDPHGDLAHDLLDHVPRWRTDHVVYFNPADHDHPFGLNLLRSVRPERRHLVASGVVGAFKSIWRDSWGPRLEYLLYASVAALLEVENATILGVPRLLSDDAYRERVVDRVRDPAVRAFWTTEFAGWDRRYRSEAAGPVQNKVGQLLMSPPVRNVFGQVSSRFDARFTMDRRRIFIANLSKGMLGEDKANLLGAILVTQFHLAAMSRADVAESERPDFFLSVDEFTSFSTDSFASTLAEARKYRLALALFHQQTGQMSDTVRDAVFGNVGNLIAFRVGEDDARLMARQFGNVYPPAVFTSLANYEVCVRNLRDGDPADPFLGKTLAPLDPRHGRRDAIVRRSRERFATPRPVVEDKLRRWSER